MSSSGNFSFETILASPPGRSALIILTTMVISASLMLVYLIDLDSGFVPFTFLVQSGLGISSGVMTRSLLRDRNRSLQVLVAMVAMIIGQGVLGFLSQGVVGLKLNLDASLGTLNWFRLLQICWSGTVVLLVTLAWNRGTRRKQTNDKLGLDQKQTGNGFTKSGKNSAKGNNLIQKFRTTSAHSGNPEPSISDKEKHKESRMKVSTAGVILNHPRVHLSPSRRKQQIHLQQAKLKGNHILQKDRLGDHFQRMKDRKYLEILKENFGRWTRTLKTRFSSFPGIKRKVTRGKNQVKLTQGNFVNLRPRTIFPNRKSNTVKLVGEEEHICPYCLDTVARNDRRGLKKCPICKTWHHADCWEEVGECQVPHYQK